MKSASAQAPYFVEWVKSQLADRFGQDQLYRGGLVVKTTLDLDAQRAAEKAIASTLDRKGDPSAALVAIRPGTGEVMAMVGAATSRRSSSTPLSRATGASPARRSSRSYSQPRWPTG